MVVKMSSSLRALKEHCLIPTLALTPSVLHHHRWLPLVAWGPVVSKMFAGPVAKSFEEHGIELISFPFSGECDRGQIGLGIEKAKAGNADVVIGIGGGKAIDLGKAVAMNVGAKYVSSPTIASNDAPTSAATVYYTEDGIMDGWDLWPVNPDLVLVDCVWVACLARSGFLYPLHELDSQWDRITLVSDLPTAVLDANSYEGWLYAAPCAADTSVLWYRKDWFEREGMAPPRYRHDLVTVAKHFLQPAVRER